MGILEILVISVGLSMDAFAVSICKGLSCKRLDLIKFLLIGLWFGTFQGLMPVIGYIFAARFGNHIQNIDHWLAFMLLGFLGFNMIREGYKCPDEKVSTSFKAKDMLLLALATSIDAMVVGITFALLPGVNIFSSVLSIAIITFFMSALGLKIGHTFGIKLKNKAEILGGLILVFMGVKILFEHLHILNF